jgi:hypothetical protein
MIDLLVKFCETWSKETAWWSPMRTKVDPNQLDRRQILNRNRLLPFSEAFTDD